MNEDEVINVFALTPENIPEFAQKTGRSEDGLLEEYTRAKAQGKQLMGCYLPRPWFFDETAVASAVKVDEVGERGEE